MAKNKRRPEDDAERNSCINALNPKVGDEDLHPVLAAILLHLFAPSRDTYLATRQAYATAKAASEAADDTVKAVDGEFDEDFRLWVGTVRGAGGKPVPRELAKLLKGSLPGELVKLPFQEEVVRTESMLTGIELLPALKGDADKLAALKVSHAALAIAAATDESATRTKTDASAALSAATAEFDKWWGFVVQAITLISPDDMATLLPVFVRASAPSKKPIPSPPQVVPAQVVPAQAEPAQAEPAQAESTQAEPAQAEPTEEAEADDDSAAA